jgi:sialate O-acetylesterase
MKKFLWLISGILAFLPSISQPKPAGIFGHHMVLQRNKPVRIWGTATSGESVRVVLGQRTAKTTANRQGQWDLQLPAMEAGGPYTMTIEGKGSVRFDDIYIGEVWVCSGQSNMEWSLSNTDSADFEIPRANHPLIRHILVPKQVSLQPEADIKPAQWQSCTPETAGGFTAVGYYFAKNLQASLGVPIGIIHSSWGGTHVETWTSGESFFAEPAFASLKDRMPANTDSVFAMRSRQLQAVIVRVQPALPVASEARQYRLEGFNDQSWKTMRLPGTWESQGFPELDGTVWFRRKFQIPAEISTKGATLYLSMIDDDDSTFINGVFVGSTQGYNQRRIYKISAGQLKAENTIAVKIMDPGGDGGIYGDARDLRLEIGDVRVPLDGNWAFRIERMAQEALQLGPNAYPTLLYNAMIHPIIRFPVRGMTWYQGESNAGRAKQYRMSFPLLIKDWRTQWKDSSMPFYFVQLTHWKAGGGNSRNGGSSWAELREAQDLTLRLPHTGMAVITDIGNTEDIHPRNKRDVGKRLALQALAGTYGKDMPAQSPRYRSMRREGNRLILQFDHLYEGWEVRNPYGYINGFELAGADQRFFLARARKSGTEIIVEADEVPEPIAVRYCWSDDPHDVNLFNSIGLPATPFRTDNWKMKTSGNGFTALSRFPPGKGPLPRFSPYPERSRIPAGNAGPSPR